MKTRQPELEQDLLTLRASLEPLPDPSVRASFILVSGLPGTGKSYFSRRLAEVVPLAVLETDALRRTLFQPPTYSVGESNRLFQVVHQLLAELLGMRTSVVLDATNLVERHRETLYSIAESAGAHLIIVRTEAASTIVQDRLEQRTEGAPKDDHSKAGWGVYQRMRPSEEPIGRNHIRVNTTEDLGPAIRKIVREIARWNRP